jgi:ankyrin repeat protein
MTARLSRVAEQGSIDEVRALLDSGAPVDARDDAHYAAIHHAARRGDLALTTLLLERGAEIDLRDVERWTPLLWATINQHAPVVALLLARGARPNLKDGDGNAALHETCQPSDTPEHRLAITKLLVDGGAKVDLVNRSKQTPLLCAAFAGLVDVVSFLAERGADLDARARNGLSPFVQAIRAGRPAVIARLLELGVDPGSDPAGVRSAVAEIEQWLDQDRTDYDFRGALALLRSRGII